MGSSGIKHVYQKWQSNLVNKNEEDYLKKCDQVFTLNYKDKDLLSKYYGIQNVEVITPIMVLSLMQFKIYMLKKKRILFALSD